MHLTVQRLFCITGEREGNLKKVILFLKNQKNFAKR